MKIQKKHSIIGLSLVAVLVTGALAVAVNKQPEANDSLKEVTVDKTEVVYLAPPAVVESKTAPVEKTVVKEQAPAVETAPVVRSFEQIVLDYPSMSTLSAGQPQCANDMKLAFPEMFQDHNREQNIKGVSQRFANACSATGVKTARHEMRLLGEFFATNGVQ